ncbi:spore coat protein U domain-containing protein [Roseicyclus mahoneyensis]|jgi:spore coat protein U-like protein|uniref:Spore coat protein U-like protein n=1 Tax=Roseicyclus mahoneyensis TaxID=164332 RepID=A0A316G7F6_9RHOB|nr:spore coat protein U domain-containing protein [Roseicyclus mahoneyensis]PWK55876.1 spore coat protein U-like protein [Roseicyclus mahoneyensis]
MNSRSAPSLAAGMLVAAVGLAQAQTATGEMGVSAEVARTCTLSAEPLAFGTLSVTEVTNGSALVTLECNGVSTVTTILVGMGANADPPTTQRNLAAGIDDRVPYTLHELEAGGADIATDGAVTLVQVGTTNTYTATLYGKIQPSPAYPMGTYADTVILTANYAP